MDEMNETTIKLDKSDWVEFAPVELDGKGNQAWVFLTRYDLYMTTPTNSRVFHYSVHDSLSHHLITFTSSNGKLALGAIDSRNNKVYMWDDQGNLCQGFPLHGSVSFDVAEMNADGQFYFATATGNIVYVYNVP